MHEYDIDRFLNIRSAGYNNGLSVNRLGVFALSGDKKQPPVSLTIGFKLVAAYCSNRDAN